MASNRYDAIVVGARCAGSPTAMLLARRGWRVLLVDRATFPSDTVSTHLIHPPGVALLERWGLLDRLVATNCPPIPTYSLDLGPFEIAGSPAIPEAKVGYAPRRTVLDKLLLDAAVEAGAEVREGFAVDEIVFDDGAVTGIRGRGANGGAVTEWAQVVVGADGIHSLVARSVGAESYQEKPPFMVGYYSYFSGLPMRGRFEGYDRGDRGFAAWETNDGLTLVISGWPMAEFEANRQDVEKHYLDSFERAPAFAARVRSAKREERFYGMAVPNYFRAPHGPGWVLLGDAGYNKEFITAQGISDAFRQAEAAASALDDAFAGRRPLAEGMKAFRAERDARLPHSEFAQQFASMQPPPPEQKQLMAAVSGNREASDAFIRMFAGALSPAEFFAPDHVGKIMAAAAAR